MEEVGPTEMATAMTYSIVKHFAKMEETMDQIHQIHQIPEPTTTMAEEAGVWVPDSDSELDWAPPLLLERGVVVPSCHLPAESRSC